MAQGRLPSPIISSSGSKRLSSKALDESHPDNVKREIPQENHFKFSCAFLSVTFSRTYSAHLPPREFSRLSSLSTCSMTRADRSRVTSPSRVSRPWSTHRDREYYTGANDRTFAISNALFAEVKGAEVLAQDLLSN